MGMIKEFKEFAGNVFLLKLQRNINKTGMGKPMLGNLDYRWEGPPQLLNSPGYYLKYACLPYYIILDNSLRQFIL